MDWNLKIPCWDFTEFEQETIPTIDLTNGLNFSVDLKLGQVIDTRNEYKDSVNSKGLSGSTSKMALSPSGSSKRARPGAANNNPIQGANCLVDGCKSDLSRCKEYHRRHKVCEIHSKTPEVSINGHKQRFCQQCSRFHSLEEFDEGKRSCRKRLDGHNRRRRKPQPDTTTSQAAAASLFSTHQGTRMIQFSSPHHHVYQTTTPLTSPLWTGMVKSPTSYLTPAHKQNPFPQSSSSGIKKEQPQRHFSLFHNGSGSHLLSFRSNNSSSGSSSSSYDKFCDEYPPPARVVVRPVVQSDCALSLLSSSPSQTSCSTPNHVMHPLFTATPNLMDPGAGYGGLDSIMDHHHVSPDNNNNKNNNNSNSEAPPTLAFYWE